MFPSACFKCLIIWMLLCGIPCTPLGAFKGFLRRFRHFCIHKKSLCKFVKTLLNPSLLASSDQFGDNLVEMFLPTRSRSCAPPNDINMFGIFHCYYWWFFYDIDQTPSKCFRLIHIVETRLVFPRPPIEVELLPPWLPPLLSLLEHPRSSLLKSPRLSPCVRGHLPLRFGSEVTTTFTTSSSVSKLTADWKSSKACTPLKAYVPSSNVGGDWYILNDVVWEIW